MVVVVVVLHVLRVEGKVLETGAEGLHGSAYARS